ncbi:MAG: biotin--[acetyl-CoA-carboxylase] ligase [Candidatus Eremiobacteraeota bacterium]|nr:biotin--[acetyl-CoA-carboxylase] ligase [Candidatus Eremiobacteraeota bacterium]
MPAAPNPYASVEAALVGTPFAQVRYLTETASTNEDASALLGQAESGGLTIVADHQTTGAGRKGRSWLARPGSSLLFTTILPEAFPATNLWAVPFWTALAVRAGLAACGIETDLHWPNDLLVGPRKIAGILCASRISGPRAHVACGVGINVTRTPEAKAEIAPAPAFCDDVAPVDRVELLATILTQFASSLTMLDGPQRVARRWETAAGFPGKRYCILLDGASKPFEAEAIALATGGSLVVDRNGTRETIALADARALR